MFPDNCITWISPSCLFVLCCFNCVICVVWCNIDHKNNLHRHAFWPCDVSICWFMLPYNSIYHMYITFMDVCIMLFQLCYLCSLVITLNTRIPNTFMMCYVCLLITTLMTRICLPYAYFCCIIIKFITWIFNTNMLAYIMMHQMYCSCCMIIEFITGIFNTNMLAYIMMHQTYCSCLPCDHINHKECVTSLCLLVLWCFYLLFTVP